MDAEQEEISERIETINQVLARTLMLSPCILN